MTKLRFHIGKKIRLQNIYRVNHPHPANRGVLSSLRARTQNIDRSIDKNMSQENKINHAHFIMMIFRVDKNKNNSPYIFCPAIFNLQLALYFPTSLGFPRTASPPGAVEIDYEYKNHAPKLYVIAYNTAQQEYRVY
ncbi:hypothetical protein NQ315_009512 [Exocentrus adspersus]|uniref:Uncharacterized protein n=1 Tax=Exocentrus adspersus TaxID=1586481 RepID=A0AAV8WGI2_9CUCU|nr:hypothetical protein NQ315_009512 [Exocentrus adspersus]